MGTFGGTRLEMRRHTYVLMVPVVSESRFRRPGGPRVIIVIPKIDLQGAQGGALHDAKQVQILLISLYLFIDGYLG